MLDAPGPGLLRLKPPSFLVTHSHHFWCYDIPDTSSLRSKPHKKPKTPRWGTCSFLTTFAAQTAAPWVNGTGCCRKFMHPNAVVRTTEPKFGLGPGRTADSGKTTWPWNSRPLHNFTKADGSLCHEILLSAGGPPKQHKGLGAIPGGEEGWYSEALQPDSRSWPLLRVACAKRGLQ